LVSKTCDSRGLFLNFYTARRYNIRRVFLRGVRCRFSRLSETRFRRTARYRGLSITRRRSIPPLHALGVWRSGAKRAHPLPDTRTLSARSLHAIVRQGTPLYSSNKYEWGKKMCFIRYREHEKKKKADDYPKSDTSSHCAQDAPIVTPGGRCCTLLLLLALARITAFDFFLTSRIRRRRRRFGL